MSEVISLDWIGVQLRAIQAEQRTLRAENELLRNMMGDMLRVLNDRIGNFEALTEARIDQLGARLTALIEPRFAKVETGLGGLNTKLDASIAALRVEMAEGTARILLAIEARRAS